MPVVREEVVKGKAKGTSVNCSRRPRNSKSWYISPRKAAISIGNHRLSVRLVRCRTSTNARMFAGHSGGCELGWQRAISSSSGMC